MSTLTIESDIHFSRCGRGARKAMELGIESKPERPAGRLPRITRLMALAIRFDELLRAGEVADYAELARLGQVTRARVTQIMNLLMLAPDIQEEILHLPRVTDGRDPIHLRQLQSITLVPDWREQRRLWMEQMSTTEWPLTAVRCVPEQSAFLLRVYDRRTSDFIPGPQGGGARGCDAVRLMNARHLISLLPEHEIGVRLNSLDLFEVANPMSCR